MAWFGKKKEETPATAESPAQPGDTQATAAGKRSWMGYFQAGLEKTRETLFTDIRDLLKTEGRLVDEDFCRDLYAILVKTDMGPGPAAAIRDQIFYDFRARKVHMPEILAVIKKKLRELMDQPEEPIKFAASGPTVVMVVGVNGSGKTTSIAKLAQLFVSQGKKVVLGAGDTFRAAAVEQLAIWAERIGCAIVRAEHGADPASVAFKAVAQAVETDADICIVDTAGRLQTQANLMKELEKIHRVMAKQIPEAPHEVLLVIDATAGQNGISQARGFSEAAKCTGIVLSKLDGTAKGGVVVAIRQNFKLPVKYIGVGEKAADLALFNPDTFVDELLNERLRGS
jgi:fused signal recognition particle receptor